MRISKLKTGILCFLAAMFCIFSAQFVNAEEAYTVLNGGSSMAGAVAVSKDKMYAGMMQGTAGEAIYYKIKTPAAKGYFEIYGMNININTHPWASEDYLKMSIITSIEENVCTLSLRKGDSRQCNVRLNPSSTYYIRFTNPYGERSAGNYKFKFSYTEDKGGDTKETAKSVSFDKKIVGTMDGAADCDVYKIRTSSLKKYSLEAQNVNIATHSWARDNQFYVQIQSEISEQIGLIRLTPGSTYAIDVELLPNTTYYIYVYNPYDPSVAHNGTYTFKISALRTDISKTIMSYKTSTIYSGKNITPAVTITHNEKKLKSGVDYTLTYKYNKAPGIATIKVTGKGAYNGAVTLKFQIKPQKGAISSIKGQKGKISVVMKPLKEVTGYQVQYATNSSFNSAKVKKVKNEAVNITAAPGKTYYVRVRGYVKAGDTYVWGKWSNVKKCSVKK